MYGGKIGQNGRSIAFWIARLHTDIAVTRNKLIEEVQHRQPYIGWLQAQDVLKVLQYVEGLIANTPPDPSDATKRAASESPPAPPVKRAKTVEDPQDKLTTEISALVAAAEEGREPPNRSEDGRKPYVHPVEAHEAFIQAAENFKQAHLKALEEIEDLKQENEGLKRKLAQHGLAQLVAHSNKPPSAVLAPPGEQDTRSPATAPPAPSPVLPPALAPPGEQHTQHPAKALPALSSVSTSTLAPLSQPDTPQAPASAPSAPPPIPAPAHAPPGEQDTQQPTSAPPAQSSTSATN